MSANTSVKELCMTTKRRNAHCSSARDVPAASSASLDTVAAAGRGCHVTVENADARLRATIPDQSQCKRNVATATEVEADSRLHTDSKIPERHVTGATALSKRTQSCFVDSCVRLATLMLRSASSVLARSAAGCTVQCAFEDNNERSALSP